IGRREGPAENLDAPAVGLDQIENRANERRLPGAVRSEESEDLAAIDIERHVVERLRLPEALRDAVDVNDRSHGPKATSSVRRTQNRLCSCLTTWINGIGYATRRRVNETLVYEEGPMTPEQAAKQWVESFNAHDLKTLVNLYAENALNAQPHLPTPIKGKHAIQEDLNGFVTAFPDCRLQAIHVVVTGNVSAMEWVFTG